MIQTWVKQLIPIKRWDNYCSNNSTYCFLKKIKREGVWAGFCLATEDGKIPEQKKDKLKSLSLDEMRRVDIYRRANHIRPFPLETKEERIAREEEESDN